MTLKKFQVRLNQVEFELRLGRVDFLYLVTLFLAFGIMSWNSSQYFDDRIVWAANTSRNIYFEADFHSMFDVFGLGVPLNPIFIAVHPLLGFLLLLNYHVAQLMALPINIALRLLLAGSAGISSNLIYLTARGIGARPFSAALAVLAAGSTAAVTHWSGVPEHFAFAVPTIAAPLALLAASRSRSIVSWAAATALSGAITVTNFASGGLCALARLTFWRSAVAVGLGVSCVVLGNLLWTRTLAPGLPSMLDVRLFFGILFFFTVFRP